MDLKKRILTSIIAIPLVLAPLVLTPLISVLSASVLILLLAYAELRNFNGRVGLPIPVVSLTLLILGAVNLDSISDHNLLILAIAGIASCIVLPVVPPERPAWQRLLLAEWTALAWIASTLLVFISVHQRNIGDQLWDFRNPILFGFIPLWIGDTTAMLVGRRFGKHKLWEEVSPAKTWEGAIANLFANVAGAMGLGALMGMEMPICAAIGLGTGICGQLGDLFESWFKRKASVKDSGTLFPGHGGLLDRYDSLGFAAIAILAVLLAFNR
jgi:phosphatidate cytidylyltransferase